MDKFTTQYEVYAKQNNARLFCNEYGYDIPYNQRNYVWDDSCIEKYIKDLDDVYEGKTSFLTYGTLYFLSELENSTYKTTIWDGQQRVLTHYIFLSSFYNYIMNTKKKFEELNNNIESVQRCNVVIGKLENYLFKKEYMLSVEEKNIAKKNNIKIPKINSIYNKDNNTLQMMSNRKLINLLECYSNEKENDYFCNNHDKCHKKYKTEQNMIDHILDCYKSDYNIKIYNDNKIDPLNNMSKAYHKFNVYLSNTFDNDIDNSYIDNLIRLLAIFEEQIPHEQFVCKGVECASILFDLLNNRGKKLTEGDIIRNSIIRKIPSESRQKYFDELEKIISFSKNFKMTKRSENVLRLIIEITNMKFEESSSLLKASDTLIQKNENIIDCADLFKKIEENKNLLEKIESKLEENNYGKLLLTEIVWDVFHYIIFPFYVKIKKSCQNNKKKMKKYLNKLYEIIVCYQIRTCMDRIFSNLQKKYVDIGNKILNLNFDDEKNIDDIFVEVKTFIKKNLLKDNDNFCEKMSIYNFKRQYALKILMYFSIKKMSDSVLFDLNKIDIEHICPKNTKYKEKLINRIGNLTLFESGNNENGMKGNRCVKDKPFTEKKEYYKQSSINMTKEIGDKYSTWNDNDIKKRSKEISSFVDKETALILNLN